jgi:hypothetical protein
VNQPRVIMGEVFGRAVADALGLGDGSGIRRIVIDAQAGRELKGHVEHYGDERLLNVVPLLDGVEVHTGTPQRDPGAPTATQAIWDAAGAAARPFAAGIAEQAAVSGDLKVIGRGVARVARAVLTAVEPLIRADERARCYQPTHGPDEPDQPPPGPAGTSGGS